jgi:hypothetical protein
MATTKDSIVLQTNEAKIILDWDDEQWYVSDIEYSTDDSDASASSSISTTSGGSGGVKVPEWDTSYKYSENDIVAHAGILYVSKQNQNQGNDPSTGTFWWNTVVNLTTVDAITLEGMNLNEIIRAVLGGNVITDYYKKSETDNIILTYFNNVNSKKLSDWTLSDIRDDYKTLIDAAKQSANTFTTEYLNDDSNGSFDQSMVAVFNEAIVDDNINQI